MPKYVLADAKLWPDTNKVLMFQCVLIRRAQKAYLALCAEDNLDYDMVKSASLKFRSTLPEA